MSERALPQHRLSRRMRSLALLVGLAQLALLLYRVVRRVGYPYDLEWMEGGMLCHAVRLGQGEPIYAPPSVDFIPFLYTPLYPALLAVLGKIVPGGVGYLMARLVSFASFALATVLGWRFIVRHGGSRAAATVAMALPAAAFAATGSWYDLARPDSLWLLLITAGLLLLPHAARDLRRGERRTGGHAHAEIALAALLLVAAFFTKQTAAPLLLAGGVSLLVLNPRLVLTYGLTLAGVGLPALWLLDRDSAGWFWTYIFRLHQSHTFYSYRAFVETPLTLFGILGPAALVVPWALVRRPTLGLLYATWLAVCGIAVSCVAFGTQWAFVNAYIPGVFFPALAIGVAAGLLTHPRRVPMLRETARNVHGHGPGELDQAPPRLRPAVVYLLLAVSLVLHPSDYDPRRFLPSDADRVAGDALIARLRQTPGEVLIPFHPFYAHLAGKRTFLHRMGVLDIAASGLGAPRGFAQAAAAHRWQLAVFDDKVWGNWNFFPGLLDAYVISEEITGPRVVSGAPTMPRYVLVPRTGRTHRPSDTLIDRELQ